MAVDLDAIESYAKSGDDTELLALVAEARAARQQAGQAELARANIQWWIQRLEASGSGRGALADDMRQFLAAYLTVTKETSQ